MQIVPITATPSQTMSIVLGGQNCTINVFQKERGTYLDLYVLDAPIVTGTLCLNMNRIVRDAYLGFVGDLAFLDTTGNLTDPNDYTKFGTTYALLYLQAGIDV